MKRPLPSHFTYRKNVLNRVSVILLYLFIVGNLKWFKKVTLPNVLFVPVARDHDPFHGSKNMTARQTFFSKKNFLLLELRIIHIKHFICMSKLQIWHLKKCIFGVKTYLTAMRCSVTSHFDVNFRDKISTCVFDFQRKIVIALPIELMFYTT